MALTGQAYINVNGRKLRSKKGASLEVGGKIGKSAMSTTGYEGMYTDEIKPAKIKCSVFHSDKDDLTAIQSIRDAVVTFETDSGQTYLINSAGTTNTVEIKDEGYELEMEGAPAELL